MKIIGVFRMRLLAIALLALFGLFISSCDTSGKTKPITITISPTTATVSIAETEQFTATVVGSTNTAVTWSATGGTIDNNGLFTAGNTAGTFEVKAVSVADTSKSATAVVTVANATVVSIELSPKTANITTGANQQFTATVAGSNDKAVTWSATGGSISKAGLFTAGNVVGTFEVKAVSIADPSKSATAVVTITKDISINPDSATVFTNASKQFKVVGLENSEVTWSATGGTIDNSGLFTAGSTIGNFEVKAVSKADASIFATAAVKVIVEPVVVSISSAVKEYYVSNKIQFKASVSGTANQGVSWSASAGIITSNGLYTAPSNVGPVTITAKWNADNSKTANITIQIKELGKTWHKWLGSNGDDYARALATDKDGNVYLAGYTKGAFFAETNQGNNDAFIVKYDKDGNEIWHKWLGSNKHDATRALATDKDGNVYLIGRTTGALFTETNQGDFDTFIVKYDKDGNKLWHKWLGSNQHDFADTLATDTDGNVYLAGFTKGALFDETNQGDYDTFIVKYDKDGNKLWHKWLGSNKYDATQALATDKDGNVYLSGFTKGAFFAETNQGNNDTFIVKYDKDGNEIWHKWLGSNKHDATRALATDKDGNVYLIGRTTGALFTETNQGDFDTFIVKYDKDGNKLWHKWLGSNQHDFADTLATDTDGNVYLAGFTKGALFDETNQGDYDTFIVKYDKDGNKLWHKWLGSNKYDATQALATDKDGNVYLSGFTKGAFFAETNQGNNDTFIVKFKQ